MESFSSPKSIEGSVDLMYAVKMLNEVLQKYVL